MRAAAIFQMIVAGLAALGLGGTVAMGASRSGFHDGLNAPALIAVLSVAYFSFAVMNIKNPGSYGGILGLLLLVPFVSAIASIFDYETPGFIVGSIPGAIFGITSLVIAIKAKKHRTIESK